MHTVYTSVYIYILQIKFIINFIVSVYMIMAIVMNCFKKLNQISCIYYQ